MWQEIKLNGRFAPYQEDLISHLRKLTRNPDVSRAAVEEFLKQGSYMNMQVFSKGGQGSSMSRETINKANTLIVFWRQRPLRRKMMVT